jgi:hypothetical protein
VERKEPPQMSTDYPSELAGNWVHSFEEDSADTLVFRREDYPFPLSRRPREEFSLSPGGRLRAARAGPTDRQEWTSGRWTVDNRRLILDAPEHGDAFDIVALSADHLEIRRPPRP